MPVSSGQTLQTYEGKQDIATSTAADRVRLFGSQPTVVEWNPTLMGGRTVFSDEGRDPQHNYRRWFNRALTEARTKDYSWHCNRHTFASRLVMARVDLRTVAELMGHSSIQMTMRYAHIAPQHNRAAVDRLVPA